MVRGKLSQRQLIEAKRQAKDPNRVRNAHAYRFILGHWQRNGKVPNTQQLSEWIDDASYTVRVNRLIADMIKHGWLSQHGAGYKLKTQTDQESLIKNLMEAFETNNTELYQELKVLWEHSQNAAITKIGRKK